MINLWSKIDVISVNLIISIRVRKIHAALWSIDPTCMTQLIFFLIYTVIVLIFYVCMYVCMHVYIIIFVLIINLPPFH